MSSSCMALYEHTRRIVQIDRNSLVLSLGAMAPGKVLGGGGGFRV